MDQELIEQARLGRRAARDALVRELQDPWYRFCLSQLRNPEAARDATQETALRFLRTLSNFRGESNLKTWSMGIALNVVREMRRDRQHDATGSAIDLAAERSSAGSPSDSASDDEMQTRMQSILNDLPGRQREAIALRFFEDLSVKETASAMQCAHGTVKATVHQALLRLRAKLGVRINSSK